MPEKIRRRVIPFYEKELEKTIHGCNTLLDLGCGANSPIQHFSSRLYAVGIDCFLPAIKTSKMKGIHSDYIYTNIFNALNSFLPRSFDCVIALDLIEHLKKEEGYRLIKLMNKVAKKLIIIFTPNGYIPQDPWCNNPWQIHKSGWIISEFRELGFTIIGINGLRFLRGKYSLIKYRPTLFWEILSDITQIVVKNHPEYAFQLLCYKGTTSSLTSVRKKTINRIGSLKYLLSL